MEVHRVYQHISAQLAAKLCLRRCGLHGASTGRWTLQRPWQAGSRRRTARGPRQQPQAWHSISGTCTRPADRGSAGPSDALWCLRLVTWSLCCVSAGCRPARSTAKPSGVRGCRPHSTWEGASPVLACCELGKAKSSAGRRSLRSLPLGSTREQHAWHCPDDAVRLPVHLPVCRRAKVQAGAGLLEERVPPAGTAPSKDSCCSCASGSPTRMTLSERMALPRHCPVNQSSRASHQQPCNLWQPSPCHTAARLRQPEDPEVVSL